VARNPKAAKGGFAVKRIKTFICLLITCCVLAAFAVPAYCQDDSSAQASTISTKFDLPYVSKYVWRGSVANPDPAFQPSLTFTHKNGMSLNLWGSIDTTGINTEKSRFTEIDYTLNYAWNAGKMAMNAGVVDYVFPNTAIKTTSEVYACACLGGKFSPAISVNYDFVEARGFYTAISAGYDCAMRWNKDAAIKMNFSGKLGFATADFNNYLYGVDKSTLTDFLLSASVPVKVANSVSITPSLNYSRVMDKSLRDAVKDPDNFFTSLTASYEF